VGRIQQLGPAADGCLGSRINNYYASVHEKVEGDFWIEVLVR
jgi:hypothetical protein